MPPPPDVVTGQPDTLPTAHAALVQLLLVVEIPLTYVLLSEFMLAQCCPCHWSGRTRLRCAPTWSQLHHLYL